MIWDLKHRACWGQYSLVSIGLYDLCLSLSSCRQGLKAEKNKLVHTACIYIIIVVIETFMDLKHIYTSSQ